MRDSIVLTVYNRDTTVLRNTLRCIRRQDLTDTEIVIVDDGSTYDYSDILGYCEQYEMPVEWIHVNTCKDRPDTYNIDGYNNPAYAWNCGLEAAKGERIVMLASDCMMPDGALERARASTSPVWHASVVDEMSATYYLGPDRITPYGWMTMWQRRVIGEIRQDEAFLKGIAFEDNDFSCRLFEAAGVAEIDMRVRVFHQSHAPIAYSDELEGWTINQDYTKKKWGGIPWINQGLPNYSKETDDGKIVLMIER